MKKFVFEKFFIRLLRQNVSPGKNLAKNVSLERSCKRKKCSKNPARKFWRILAKKTFFNQGSLFSTIGLLKFRLETKIPEKKHFIQIMLEHIGIFHVSRIKITRISNYRLLYMY